MQRKLFSDGKTWYLWLSEYSALLNGYSANDKVAMMYKLVPPGTEPKPAVHFNFCTRKTEKPNSTDSTLRLQAVLWYSSQKDQYYLGMEEGQATIAVSSLIKIVTYDKALELLQLGRYRPKHLGPPRMATKPVPITHRPRTKSAQQIRPHVPKGVKESSSKSQKPEDRYALLCSRDNDMGSDWSCGFTLM